MKRIIKIMLILGILFVNGRSIQANEQKIVGKYCYTYQNYKKGVWITNIFNDKKIGGNSVLSIPITIGGKKVLKLGSFSDNGKNDSEVYNLFGELSYKKVSSKSYLSKISEIRIPETVKEITPYCFTNVGKGKNINIPSGVVKNLEQFCDGKWKKVNISKSNVKFSSNNSFLLSKDGRTAYGYMGASEKIVVPQTVTQIAKEAFKRGKYESIKIGKRVDKIGKYLCQYGKVSEILIEKNNKHYSVKSNCLYSKKSKRLVLALPKKNIISIPGGVSYMSEGSVIHGDKANQIVFSKSFKTFKSGWSKGIINEKTLSVVFKGKKPPKIKGGYLQAHVLVPKGTVALYKVALSPYFDIKEIKEFN